MIIRILAILATLCACVDAVHAQDQDEPVVFLQPVTHFHVNSVAFSPDGKVLASGSGDKTITLWDVASGRKLRTLSGHTGAVNSVAFSPDGKVLASGSWDNTVKLWEVATGRELRSLSGHAAVVTSVAFSPDGTMVASGSDDHAIKLWEAVSGRELSTLSGYTGFVRSLAFSPDGKVLASGSGELATITLWDVASGRELRTLRGHADVVWSVVFSPDGHTLASGSFDNTIKLWDVPGGRELRTLNEDNAVHSIAFSPDGKVLASATRGKTIKLWDVASGRQVRTLSGHTDEVVSVAFSPNGEAVASGSDDGTTREWDKSSGKERVALIAFIDGSYLAITPEGYYDASSAQAEEHLNVRVGSRVFPIGPFREKFYRPDLVKLGLAGVSLTRFAGIENVRVAPIVEFIDLPASTSEPRLTVNLRITDSGGGVGLVRVFLNGAAIIQDDTATPSGGPVTRRYTVQLASGRNELRAVAFNADDSMQSSPAVATIIANLPENPHATLHAIVVGIQEFKNPKYNLSYSVADAELIAETLGKYSAPLFHNKLDIKLLTTPAETARESLTQTLKDMQAVVGVDDVFVFYVASHGLVDNDQYFLLTSNVGSLSTEHLKTDAVSKEDLTALLANIPATKKLLLLFDTAHAQAVSDALVPLSLSDNTALKILSRAAGTTVLSASTSTEEALEGYQGHGLFAYVVAAGLSGKGDIDKNGYVTTLGLADYVIDQVPKLAEQLFKRAIYPTVETSGQEFPLTKIK